MQDFIFLTQVFGSSCVYIDSFFQSLIKFCVECFPNRWHHSPESSMS